MIYHSSLKFIIKKGEAAYAVAPFEGASCRIRTNDPEITNHVLWPTELKRQVDELTSSHRSTRYPCFGQDLGDSRGAGRGGLIRSAKLVHFSESAKYFFLKFHNS